MGDAAAAARISRPPMREGRTSDRAGSGGLAAQRRDRFHQNEQVDAVAHPCGALNPIHAMGQAFWQAGASSTAVPPVQVTDHEIAPPSSTAILSMASPASDALDTVEVLGTSLKMVLPL